MFLTKLESNRKDSCKFVNLLNYGHTLVGKDIPFYCIGSYIYYIGLKKIIFKISKFITILLSKIKIIKKKVSNWISEN